MPPPITTVDLGSWTSLLLLLLTRLTSLASPNKLALKPSQSLWMDPYK